jgi:hypothetical protein
MRMFEINIDLGLLRQYLINKSAEAGFNTLDSKHLDSGLDIYRSFINWFFGLIKSSSVKSERTVLYTSYSPI